LLGFQKGASEQVDVHEGILDGCWRSILVHLTITLSSTFARIWYSNQWTNPRGTKFTLACQIWSLLFTWETSA
jgi:hypothetical protein